MQDVYPAVEGSLGVRLVRQQIQTSGNMLEKLVHDLQLIVKGLSSGDIQTSREIFWKVIAELDEFLQVLQRTEACAGKLGTVLNGFQSRLTEYFHRLDALQQDGEVGVFLDVLQYELIPLLVGWDGVKKGLVDYLGDVD